jgi:probable phosphoglycerate mutase
MGATLVLVRHGQTEWSRSGRHTGRTDIDLTASGEATAQGLGPVLARQAFDLVLTSPRLRARRTAALAGFPEATVEDDLAEWDYGDYEGLTTPQIREQDPGWTIWDRPVPGGESAEEVAARLDRVVARVRATDGRALVFAHGHSLRVLAARWLGLPVADGRIFDLDTATYSVLGDDRGQPVVQRWNVGAGV